MAKQIILTVNPDGSTTVETKGFVGARCKDASAFLENALGNVQSETLKPEYHQRQSSTQENKQRA